MLIFLSCKKPNQNNPPPPQNNNTQTQQQQLVGNWILRKSITYNNGKALGYTNYYSPSTCYLNLQSSISSASTNSNTYYNVLFGLDCSPHIGWWYVNAPNMINFDGSISNILYLSNDSLVLQSSVSTDTYKYFLNKTTNTCGQSPKEVTLTKNWTLYEQYTMGQTGMVGGITTYTTAPIPTLNLQNTWYNGNTVATNGWVCITTGTSNPILNSYGNWEVLGTDSLNISAVYYHIDTLTSAALSISHVSSTYTTSYHFH